MTQAGIDPFATAPAPSADGDDPFATPRTSFLKPKAIGGRLCLAYPTKVMKDLPAKQRGQFYDAIVMDLHVLDGEPITIGDDKPLPIPATVNDFRLTNDQFVGGMSRLIGTKMPFLFRMGSGPSKVNEDVTAFWPETPTEADKVKAKQYMASRGLL